MPGTTAKRVVLYRFDRQPVEGFVASIAFDCASPVEVMSLEGSLQSLAYREVKALCFVSETGAANLFSEHTRFQRRPKVPGLWATFSLRDGDSLDGVLSHNLADWPEAGFLLTPPRAGSLRQRVFLPRAALVKTELRGVIGRAEKPRSELTTAVPGAGQLSMFD